MLSRADSYLDDALKLDCDVRGDGSWGLSGVSSTSPNVMDDALLNTWPKKYIPRCLMQKKKKAGFADRLISSMTWEQAKNLKTEDWTGGA